MKNFFKSFTGLHTISHLIPVIVWGLASAALAVQFPSDYGISAPSSQVENLGDFYNILCVTTSWILVFGLIIGVLFIIWGGVKYITAGGESGKADDGKGIITNALIGVVLLILAVALVKIVARFFGSSSLDNFDLTDCR